MLKREVESPIPGLQYAETRGRKPYSWSVKMLKREVESPIPGLQYAAMIDGKNNS